MVYETRILETTPGQVCEKSLLLASEMLKKGRLIAFPTETVYGLGANIFIEDAVNEIFRVKQRPADNPLIVHVSTVQQAKKLMQSVPEYFDTLTALFWPGPLTLVVPRNAAVLDCISTGLDTVAVRMPDHPIALRLIRKTGVPLAAPSANISGKPSPTSAGEVYADLQGKIFAVLDGGPCIHGIESTVLDLSGKTPVILRPGIITKQEIERAIGVKIRSARATTARPLSPGMKYTHYAPHTAFYLVAGQRSTMYQRFREIVAGYKAEGKKIGVLAPSGFEGIGAEAFFSLHEGSPVDYARLMYLGMRTLDKKHLDIILCPGLAETGIGIAVMNRLRKAAAAILT